MSETPGNKAGEAGRNGVDLPADWPQIARILDANANRAEEGLRVLEDCFRFGRDDPFLAGQLKQLRHALSEALEFLPRQDCLLARDSQGDVGRAIVARGEYERDSLGGIIEANIRDRLTEVPAVERIVEEEFGRLENWSTSLGTEPTIRSLRGRVDGILEKNQMGKILFMSGGRT